MGVRNYESLCSVEVNNNIAVSTTVTAYNGVCYSISCNCSFVVAVVVVIVADAYVVNVVKCCIIIEDVAIVLLVLYSLMFVIG